MSYFAAFHLSLHCLYKYHLGVFRIKGVKEDAKSIIIKGIIIKISPVGVLAMLLSKTSTY